MQKNDKQGLEIHCLVYSDELIVVSFFFTIKCYITQAYVLYNGIATLDNVGLFRRQPFRLIVSVYSLSRHAVSHVGEKKVICLACNKCRYVDKF